MHFNFQDLYVYLSETEEFSDFNNKAALIWLEEELVYGDWTSGINGDGTYGKDMQIPISEVHFFTFLLCAEYIVLLLVYHSLKKKYVPMFVKVAIV